MNMNVRVEGMVELVLERLVELGYFKSKNDIIRMGILEVAKEYNILPTPKEVEEYLLARKMGKIHAGIKSGKVKVRRIAELKKKSPELARLE